MVLTVVCCSDRIDLDRTYKHQDRRVVKRYCYQCHAPSTSVLEDPPLDNIFSMFGGEKNLKKYRNYSAR